MKLTKLDAITLFVADPRAAAGFYGRVFEVAPLVEDENSAAFAFDGAIVNLLARSAAPDLIGPARIAPALSGSSFQLTVEVDDVDRACLELQERGVSLLNGPVNRSWGIRTASFQDLDGHIWEIAAKIAA